MNGLSLAFITAFISGTSIFANSYFVTGTDPIKFAFYRNLTVALALSAVLLINRHEAVKLKRITRRKLLGLIVIGIIGGGVPFGLFFTGLAQLGAVPANIINKSLFLWVALLSVPFLKEKLSWLQVLGYFITFYAIYVFNRTHIPISITPLIMVMVATFLWAIEHVISKKVLGSGVSVLTLSWARMLFGLPILYVFMMFNHSAINSAFPSMPIVISSLFLIFYMQYWYGAMKLAPVSRVSLVLVFAPVVTMLLESIFKGKTLTDIQVTQSAVMMTGIVMGAGIFPQIIHKLQTR